MTLASVLSHPVEQLLPLVPGTLSHILTECVDLAPARQRVFNMWADYIRDKPFLLPIIRKFTVLCTTTEQVQFILDCSVLPDVITLWQKQGSNVHDLGLILIYNSDIFEKSRPPPRFSEFPN